MEMRGISDAEPPGGFIPTQPQGVGATVAREG